MYQEEGSSAHLVSIASCHFDRRNVLECMMIMSLLLKSDVQIVGFFFSFSPLLLLVYGNLLRYR